MPRLLLAVVTSCLAAVPAAEAAEFSWEPSAFASSFEQDPLLDVDRSSLAFTHYFDPVDDAGGPYGLAAFLDPGTRVSAAVDHEKSTSHPLSYVGAVPVVLPTTGVVSESDEYSVGGRYVFPKSKWYAGGRYEDRDVDDPPFLGLRTTDSSGYAALVGKYLGAVTTVELGYDFSDRRSEGPSIFCVSGLFCSIGGTETDRAQTEEWSVAAQHVLRGRALTYSLSGRVAATSGDLTFNTSSFTIPVGLLPNPPPFLLAPVITIPARTTEIDVPRFRVYSVGGEIFPTRKLGVRLGYSRWDGDSAIDDAYDVTATWFVTRNVGLGFSFAEQRNKGDSPFVDDAETTSIRIVGRL